MILNEHRSLIMYIWDALIVNENRTKQLLRCMGRCSNHVFLLEQKKNYQVGITRCGVRYCEFANRKVQGRRIGMLENCQKRVLKLFSNVCTWHDLVDLTFCGKQGKSCNHQMDTRLWLTFLLVWFPMFKTGMTIDYVVRWETRFGIVKIENSISDGILWTCGSRTFVPKSWMCKKQNANVSEFQRIRDCSIGFKFASGRCPCSWFVGCGDEIVAFVE